MSPDKSTIDPVQLVNLDQLRVIHFPHPVLMARCGEVTRVDAQLREWISQMQALVATHEGLGLAANQVGLPYRIFVTQDEVYINPVIKNMTGGWTEHVEGCLSLPGVHINVKRHKKVKLQAYNLAGEEINATLTGMKARVIQHEVDHLDGLMFFNRVDPDLYMNLGMVAKIGVLEGNFAEAMSSGAYDIQAEMKQQMKLRSERTDYDISIAKEDEELDKLLADESAETAMAEQSEVLVSEV